MKKQSLLQLKFPGHQWIKMKTFRIVLLVIASVIIIVDLFLMDYQNFWSRENLGGQLGILAMILLIVSLILSYYERK